MPLFILLFAGTGLQYRHDEIVDAHFGSGLAFRDPDNIALELFAPPAA